MQAGCLRSQMHFYLNPLLEAIPDKNRHKKASPQSSNDRAKPRKNVASHQHLVVF